MDSLIKIQHLLQNVTKIRELNNQIAESTGANFNIFKTLKLTTKEVQLHSAFIGELLNPQGSHGHKDVFLKLFINQISKKSKIDFDTSYVKVKTEHTIGVNNDDSGGRIDILLTNNKNQVLIIENRIYAADQEAQLVRYIEHRNRKSFDKIPILYLSLDGKDADDKSKIILKEGDDYIRISYKENIIEWLTECRKEAVTQPMLRETISQYINTIETLTGQTIENAMKEAIIKEITSSKANLESFFILPKEVDVKTALIDILKKQLEDLGRKLSLQVDYNEIDFGFRESGVYFSNKHTHTIIK